MASYSFRRGAQHVDYVLEGDTLAFRRGPLQHEVRIDLLPRPACTTGLIVERLHVIAWALLAFGLGIAAWTPTQLQAPLTSLLPLLVQDASVLGLGGWLLIRYGPWRRGVTLLLHTGEKLPIYDDGSEAFRTFSAALRQRLALG